MRKIFKNCKLLTANGVKYNIEKGVYKEEDVLKVLDRLDSIPVNEEIDFEVDTEWENYGDDFQFCLKDFRVLRKNLLNFEVYAQEYHRDGRLINPHLEKEYKYGPRYGVQVDIFELVDLALGNYNDYFN